MLGQEVIMAGNGHWSQYSHTPKILFLHAFPFYLLVGAFFIHSTAYLVIVALSFIYCIVFSLLKMPMQYTGVMLRTLITGKSKTVRNKDNLLDF